MSFKSNFNISLYVSTEMSKEELNSVLAKYEIASDAIVNKNNNGVIRDNISSYEVLLNKTVFTTILSGIAQQDLSRFTELNKIITVTKNNYSDGTKTDYINKVYNQLVKFVGCVCDSEITCDDIKTALDIFGLEEVNSETDMEFTDDFGSLDSMDIDLSNLDLGVEEFDGGDFDESDVDLSDFNTDNTNIFDVNFDYEEDSEGDFGDFDFGGEDEADSSGVVECKQEEISTDSKEKRKLLETIFGTVINSRISTMVNSMSELYRSGFESMPQAGLLINGGEDAAPLLHIKATDGDYKATRNFDGGSITDLSIFKTLSGFIPELSVYSVEDGDRPVPNVNKLLTANTVCYKLHLQFQSANIKYCTGEYGIRQWVKETQLEKSGCSNFEEWIEKCNNKVTVRLTSFKQVKQWYNWYLSKLIYNLLDEYNVEPKLSSSEAVGEILTALYRNIKNIVVVAERNIGKNYEIRVSTDSLLDNNDLVRALESNLNVGNDRSTFVRIMGNNSSGVIKFGVILDRESENSTQLFAHEVLDNILTSGNTPSWSHALLGKTEDGTYMFWDQFMDPAKALPSKRCYAIYAESRSGKGIMTSTLVASALCDKKEVFYTDGKPENGACLGEIAWSRGKEAYVFNGTPKGAVPYGGSMEQYSKGVREEEEIYEFAKNLPKQLFEDKLFTPASQREFLSLMRYLKSMMLCSEVILARVKGTVPSDNWQVWVFDEMTKMSSIEKKIRRIFLNYIANRVTIKKASSDDKVDYLVSINNDDKLKKFISQGENYDAGIEYIYKWLKWNDTIKSNMHSAAVIELGKANMNLIFIFQEPSWIPRECNITTIAGVVDALDCTKIVGKGGISPLCRDYGDGTTKGPWVDKINSGTGWWAISNSKDIRRDNPKLFKPFSVYTKQLPEDMDKPAERYLDGYVTKLLGNYGIDPADVLQSSYTYAEEAVKVLGLAGTLKEFIYDCSNLSGTAIDNSLETLGAEGEVGESTSDGFSKSIDDIDLGGESDIAAIVGGIEDNIFGSTPVVEDKVSVSLEDTPVNFKSMSEQHILNENTANKMQFMTTKELMNKNINDSILGMYFDRYIFNRIKDNRFDYKDRDDRSKNGLRIATIVLSTLHYCCKLRQVYNIDNIKSALYNNLRSGINNGIALGMLEDYDGGMEYDIMPTIEMLKNYVDKSNATVQSMMNNNGNMMVGNQNNGVVGNVAFSGGSAIPNESYPMDISPSYYNIGNELSLAPRMTQNTMVIPPNESLNSVVSSGGFIERYKKNLFESRNGTAYEFKKRWEYVLHCIKVNFPNKSMIQRISLSGSQIIVNNKVIRLDNVLGGDYGVQLEDIIMLKMTFKEFPLIRQIILDSQASRCMMREYGSGADGIKEMFNTHKSLESIGVIPNGSDNIMEYNRNDSVNNSKELDVESVKMKLEEAAAIKNPRLSEKTPGHTARFFNNSKTASKNMFSTSGKYMLQDKNPKLLRAAGYSVIGTGFIAIGATVGAIGFIAGGGKKLFNMFK